MRRPKLGPWQGVIEAILEEDKSQPRKRRHTAKRIFARLRAEHQYPGGYTKWTSEAVVVIAGVESKAHFFIMDLPHSDDCFVTAFLEGHVRAFAYFGGVPTRILHDTTTLAVSRILGDGQRQTNAR